MYEMYTYYNKDTETAKYSFEKLIREYAPFDDDNEKTFCLEEAMKIYEKFYKLLDYPFGNLDGIYFPEEMELEIEDFNKRLSALQPQRKAKTKKMMIIYLILLGVFAPAALVFQLIQG